ncbi:MAG: S-layer homology domain-containing protein [Oscillospiraceae bacterium]|nr:S-layer homology domain-containing protein [Oscillospiraceae bacterium]
MTKIKRVLSLLLSLLLLLGLIPAEAFPVEAVEYTPEGKPAELTTAEGEKVEVDEESWEELYPYGAFLFETGETNLTEGGEPGLVRLYRLGGTAGRATAYVYYNPTIMALDEETLSYASALGSGDIRIEVEDTLPVAAYQPVGKPEDPEPSEAQLRNDAYTGEEAQEGDRVLTVDAAAESWQWYISTEGVWESVEGAVNPEFVVAGEYLDGYDFRCVYTQDGTSYCSRSLKGETYIKPEAEVLPEQPEDLDLNPEQSFTALEMDPEDPFSGYAFAVTFADGEWVKEIRVTPVDDTEAEPMEFASLTLVEHDGGAIYSPCAALTLSVTDNEAPEAFTVGFTEARYEADKAEGSAFFTIKRTGGNQTMVTIDYATEDGTAVAGEDYIETSGTAAFYAGIDEAVIEVPLIDNGVASGEARSFRVTLSGLKGDGAGLCTLGITEAEVALTNSGTGGAANLATLLYDAETVDASGDVVEAEEIAAPVDEGVITGQQIVMPEEDLLRGEIAGFDPEEADGDEAGLMTYNYGEITFPGQHSGSYWWDYAYLTGSAPDLSGGWSGGHARGSGWEVTGKGGQSASLTIAYMPQMYQGFYGQYSFTSQLSSCWHDYWGWAYGRASVYGNNKTLASANANPRFWKSGLFDLVGNLESRNPNGTINTKWGPAEDVHYLGLNIEKHYCDADSDASSYMYNAYLTRRTLANNLRLRIHTANDGESGNGNVVTAPDGAASLKENSGVYGSIKPQVTVVPHAGGVSNDGKLYVGSKINVTLNNVDSFRPYTGEVLSSAVYLTDRYGDIVDGPKIEKSGQGNSTVYTITLVWDGMKQGDIDETYTINVVMNRVQTLRLDLSPSVPRVTDQNGKATATIDTSRIGESWTDFWSRSAGGQNKITVGYSEAQREAPYFSRQIKEKSFDASAFQEENKSPVYALGSVENAQYINFNRNPNDRILYNGTLYKGNDRIWLRVEDLAYSRLTFLYYSNDHLSDGSVMSTAVSRVELYLDGDGDGKISGSYNANTGYFNIPSGSADQFVQMLDRDASYDEVTFEPVKLDNGKYAEYFLKIYYTMTPRSLTPPKDGGDARAQVLPALTTSVTDQKNYSTLTEEQKSYRYVLSGVDGSGQRTSDGHLMYGAEANRVQYVDVPLGGDRSPVEHAGDTEHGYTFTWSPKYEGNLIYTFSDPEPIFIEHSLAGDNIPLAEIDHKKGGAVQTDSAGKSNLNGYLGSFAANTTVALCVMEQEHTSDQMKANPKTAETLKPESSELIRRSAYPNASYLANMDIQDMGGGETKDTGNSGDYSQMNPTYGMDLPMQTLGLMGYATLLMNKDELMITVSIPGYSFSSTGVGEKKPGAIFPSTVTAPTDAQITEVANLMEGIGKKGDISSLKDSWKQGGYREGMKGGGLQCAKFTATVSATVIISLKYDTVTNRFEFKELAAGLLGSLSFKYTYRFTPCPLIYIYASITLSLGITSGGTMLRTAQEGKTPLIQADTAKLLKKNDYNDFKTKYTNIVLQFTGKVLIEVFDSNNATEKMKNSNTGYLQSDGGEKITIRLARDKGMEFSSEKYIRITALQDTTIRYLNAITDVKTEMVWNGVKISPTLTLEFGAGVGVDLLKFEVCIKAVASGNFTFLPYNETSKSNSGVQVQSAKFSASVMMRAVFFAYTYEIEGIGIAAKYDGKTESWNYTYTVLGEESKLQGEAEGGTQFLSLPEDGSATQRVYGPRSVYEIGNDAELMAYDPDDPLVPFQLSGYNSSVSAFKLADGLTLGNDYQVITANGENYVLYTLSRGTNKASAVDRPMLVMSRLVSTGGVGNVGLVNPLDRPTEEQAKEEAAEGETEASSKAPAWREPRYIPVDTDGSLNDDGTGDLEFHATAVGNTIRVAWVSYASRTALNGSEDTQELFRQTAKNTVIKTASFDTSQTANGFTKAETVSDKAFSDKPGRVMLPVAVHENVTAYVRAEHMSDAERAEASANYATALKAIGKDPNGSEAAAKRVGQQLLATQEMIWDGLGKRSGIRVYEKYDENSDNTCFISVPSGQVVENLEMTKPASVEDYFLAYTTRETVFTDAQGKKVTSAADARNILTIRRLYLTMLSPPFNWETVLVRTLYDYEDNTTLQDGIYTGGKLTPYKDPYFANLQFLNAALGDALRGEEETFTLQSEAAPEDFLLFEMNGRTYVIRQKSLWSIVDSQKGTIIPFFAVDEEQRGTPEAGVTSATGRTEVTIGADGAGGLAAVYVATVPNTTNNALYMSKYDPNTGTWGKGVILAMNHMDVYEDAVEEGWEPEEAEQAYLGRRSGYGKGGMDQFHFLNPQFALGVKGSSDAVADSVDSANPTENSGSRTTLLVLTQGNMSYLTTQEIPDGDGGKASVVVPDPEGRGKYPRGTGIYAISYGMGHQSLGEAGLSFSNDDFTAGANLYACLSFKNTGDVSIRGSKDRDQAITVSLGVHGDGVPDTRLASWTVTENIVPGQKVSLEGGFTLPVTLPKDAHFSLTVSEGSFYEASGGIPYTAALDALLTVEQKPELGFEDAAVALSGLSDGSLTLDQYGNAVLDVDLLAGNRGSVDAENVYVQFSYDTGKTDETTGAPIYAPIDISTNTLHTSVQEELASLQEVQTTNDFRNGILYLHNLWSGYGRRVTGTVTIDPDKYFVEHVDTDTSSDANGVFNALGLRIELFSAADSDVTTDKYGLREAVHGEYNSANNVFRENVEAAVTFTVADRLTLSKGTLLRLPVHYLSANGARIPSITVAEYPDKEDLDGATHTRFQRMDQNLDRLYFEERAYKNGRGEGTIVLRAAKEGCGYIRIMDQNTNSYLDIPFQVVAENMGMDIGPDNGRFTFYNKNGSTYQKGKSGDWSFPSDVAYWGSGLQKPYMGTLAKGSAGASFTFETQADAITLFLDGKAEVYSTYRYSEYNGVKVSGNGTDGAYVHFGNNLEYATHKVTVRLTQGSDIDRIVEHYFDGVDAATETTSDAAPKQYWASKLPNNKNNYGEKGYWVDLDVVGSAPLKKVEITQPGTQSNPITGVRKNSATWWTKMIWLKHNGTLEVTAVDCNGNTSIQHLPVEIFADNGSLASLAEEEPPDTEEIPDDLSWMTAELVEGEEPVIRVTVDESAPYEKVFVVGGPADKLLRWGDDDEPLTREEIMESHLTFGERGSEFTIPITEDGMYVVAAYSYDPQALLAEDWDEGLDYTITRTDGSVEEYNAEEEDQYEYNMQFLLAEGVKPNKYTVTFDSAGGSAVPAQTVEHGKTAQAPADPVRRGSSFVGWKLDNTFYTFTAPVTRDITLTAVWSQDASEPPSGGGSSDSGESSDSGGISGSGGSSGGSSTPVPAPTPTPAPEAAPLTEAEKDALLSRYSDLDKDAWYRDGVAYALRKGIMNGMGDGFFGPNIPTSRAMIVTMLWRLEGEPAVSGGASFQDAPDGQWYTDAVRWAADHGIVNGYSDTVFGPNDNVSREQLATILYRYARYKGMNVDAEASLSGFTDAGTVSNWATDAFRWTVSNGIINGMGNNILSPGTEAVRAQVATMLMRYDAIESN